MMEKITNIIKYLWEDSKKNAYGNIEHPNRWWIVLVSIFVGLITFIGFMDLLFGNLDWLFAGFIGAWLYQHRTKILETFIELTKPKETKTDIGEK